MRGKFNLNQEVPVGKVVLSNATLGDKSICPSNLSTLCETDEERRNRGRFETLAKTRTPTETGRSEGEGEGGWVVAIGVRGGSIRLVT